MLLGCSLTDIRVVGIASLPLLYSFAAYQSRFVESSRISTFFTSQDHCTQVSEWHEPASVIFRTNQQSTTLWLMLYNYLCAVLVYTFRP